MAINRYRVYFIVMADYDTFRINVKANKRPNRMNDCEIIAEYMQKKYEGHSYKIIDKNNGKYETVEV